jgi:hypothetical protein
MFHVIFAENRRETNKTKQRCKHKKEIDINTEQTQRKKNGEEEWIKNRRKNRKSQFFNLKEERVKFNFM